jgi:hypothetical protein
LRQPGLYAKIPDDVEPELAIALAGLPDERLPRVEAIALALRLAFTGDLDEATRARGWQPAKHERGWRLRPTIAGSSSRRQRSSRDVTGVATGAATVAAQPRPRQAWHRGLNAVTGTASATVTVTVTLIVTVTVTVIVAAHFDHQVRDAA